jgi:hypothetical protein
MSPSKSGGVKDVGGPRSPNVGIPVESEKTGNTAALQRELNRVKTERDVAVQQAREWQLQVGSLKAELDKERGSYDRLVASRSQEREKLIREEMNAEWAKSEAGWKERVRNERMVRMGYERILISLGFAPSRIASDLVRLSRPQPTNEDPSTYNTINLEELEAGIWSQPASTKRGLFSYHMEELKQDMNRLRPGLPQSKSQEGAVNVRGRIALLKTLASSTN